MLLAVSAMDPMIVFVFYLVAVILCVLAALNVSSPRVGLFPLGVAFFVVPFCWNAVAAS